MSYDFGNRREVTARKATKCWQCNRAIEVGLKHIYFTGKYDGDFYAVREHFECNAALCSYIDAAGLSYDEAPSPLCDYIDFEQSDKDWFAENHPIVFARLWPSPTPP